LISPNHSIQFHLRVNSSGLSSEWYDLKTEGGLSESFEDSRVHILGSIFEVMERPDLQNNSRDLCQWIRNSCLKSDWNFVAKLNGYFVIIFEDLKNQRIAIFNDRYRVGSFFYSLDTHIEFSSSFKDLFKRQREEKATNVNKGVLCNFISNGFNVSDETLIEGISRSMPTFFFIVEKDKTPQVCNHWDSEFSFSEKPIENLEASLDQYEDLYRSALKNYLSVREPSELGTLLSGGHDTSFAMIQASQVWKKPVHAFSVVFPGWEFDEGQHAKKICEKFGGIFHPIEFKSNHLDATVELIRACDEPVVGSSLSLFILSQEAKKYTDTLLGGDGGDTLWGEYYPVGEYHRWVKNLPLSGRRWLRRLAAGLRDLTDWERFWELEHVAALFASPNFYDGFLRKLCTYRHFSSEFTRALFSNNFIPDLVYAKGNKEIPFTKENFSQSLIEGKLFNGFYTYQAYHTYKAMAHCAVEFFMPTTDIGVSRFVTNLPSRWVNGGNSFQRLTNSKKINRKFHKKALRRYLAKDEIYNQSFDMPWDKIFLPRRSLLDKLLLKLKARGWYNTATLDNLFKEFIEQKVKDDELLELKNHGYRIFTLLALEIWCCEYLDGKLWDHADGSRLSLEVYFDS
jgi:asparagine synthase (glutamine-hydrolysing)